MGVNSTSFTKSLLVCGAHIVAHAWLPVAKARMAVHNTRTHPGAYEQPSSTRHKNHYVVERMLGNGGFGRVYLAYDRRHQRWCAIKEIRIEGSVDHNFVLHEIMTLKACAEWPFVPTVYDAFFDGEPPRQIGYVIMEYIEGRPMGRMEPWTGAQIAHLLDAMLANLAQLHARGFVHRDIKPDNILLTSHGTYALVDFGIAKSGTHTRSIVHPVLTPQFAAPEQFQGLGTDNRSDLYSLGATAYMLLTGTPVSAWATKQRAQQLANLHHIYPDLRPAVAHTLARLLALDPADRPRSAGAARALLAAAPRRRIRGMAAAALLLAALGMGGYAAVANRDAVGNVVQSVREGFRGVDGLPFPSPSAARTPFPTNDVQQQIRAAGGAWGVVVIDLASNTTVYSQNADTAFPAASLAKLPVVLAAYRLAEQGELDLDEQLTLEAQDNAGGTGTLQGEPTGTRYTIRELCRRMLVESDNTAGNMLLRRLGFDAVNRISADLGANATQLQRRFGDLEAQAAGRDNVTTAADIARLLQALSGGDALTQAHRTEILHALRSTDRDKLAELLPTNTAIAHKTGVLTGVEHDAGIVTVTRGQYIIVMLSQDLPDAARGRDAIAAVSQTVYAWLNEQ